MKSALFSALALVLVAVFAPGAHAANTTLEELLARMPAETPAAADANSALLLALGPDAIREAVLLVAPFSEQDNLAAEYAVSGLARYVSTGNREAARLLTAQVFLEVLAESENLELKAFLIRQLELMGGTESVAALQGLLDTPELDAPARQALTAIAMAPAPERPPLLLTVDPAPAPQLSPALLEARALADAGNTRRAIRRTRQLVRASGTPEHERIAALRLLMELHPNHALDAMRGLLDTRTEPALRLAVAQLAADMEDDGATDYWSGRLRRMSPEEAVPVLEMLAKRGDNAALPAIFRAMDHRDVRVRIAAIHALEEIERDRAYRHLLPRRAEATDPAEIAALDALLGNADPERPAGQPADEEGFIPLFNGENLQGWVGDTRGYYVEGGVIVCTDTAQRLYTANEYSDFIFRFEFQLTPGANNGIGVRHEMGTHAAIEAMEIQLLDDSAEKYANLEGWQYNGAIYGIVPPELGHLKPVGEWNAMTITAQGPQIRVELNSVTIADADVHAAVEGGTPDERDHPGVFRETGRISLLGHSSEVAFRNLSVKRLE